MIRTIRANWQPLLLLVAIPLLAHCPEFLGFVHPDPSLITSGLGTPRALPFWGAPYVDGNAGGTAQALGTLAARDWVAGNLPWWNPYAGVGMPLAAEMQPMAFFLPFVLLLNWADGLGAMKLVLQIVAGLTTYAALRQRGLARFPACIAGVLFQMNGTFAWYSDAPIMPVAFLPMLVWGIERCRAARRGGIAIVACGLAWSLVAGFPETAFIDGLVAGLWTLQAFASLGQPRGSRARLAFCLRLTAGVVLGLSLAAPSLISFLLYLREASVAMHSFATFGFLARDQVPAIALPYLFGPVLGDMQMADWTGVGGFVDAVCLFLALLAVAGVAGRTNARDAGLRLVLFGWLVVGLAMVCGQPLAEWLRHATPVLRDSSFFRYGMASLSFVASVLAGYALQDWGEDGLPRAARASRVAVAALILTAGLAVFTQRASARIALEWSWLGDWTIATFSLVAVCVASLGWLLCGSLSKRRLVAAGTLLCIQALIWFLPPVLAESRTRQLDMAPVDYLRSHIGLGRLYVVDSQLLANHPGQFGLASVQYVSVPVADNWGSYVTRHIDPTAVPGMLSQGFGNNDQLVANLRDRHAALEETGAAYALVSAAHDPLAHADPGVFAPVFANSKSRIYALRQAKPYFEVMGGPCRLDIASRTRLSAQCETPARLLRRELSFGDWQARVNRHRAAIATTHEIFQEIGLPAGRSSIRFRYVPPYANLIALLFALGVTGTLASVLAGQERRRRAGQPRPWQTSAKSSWRTADGS